MMQLLLFLVRFERGRISEGGLFLYPYLTVFEWDVPTYGVMTVIGILLSSVFLFFRRRRFSIPGNDVFHLLLFALVGAIAGAKLLHWITILPIFIGDFSYLVQHPDQLIDLIVNGFVFYGGLIGGFLLCLWYCRKFKVSFAAVTELFAPILPFFHIFGRIGCFFAGCCYGIPVPWGVIFADHSAAPAGIPLLPLQLVEAGCNVVILVAVLAFDRFFRGRGLTLPFYLVLYSICRFVLEFFRGDLARGVFLLSTSQWISIGLVLAVAIWFFVYYRRRERWQAI